MTPTTQTPLTDASSSALPPSGVSGSGDFHYDFILFESAAGYSIFKVNQWEKIGGNSSLGGFAFEAEGGGGGIYSKNEYSSPAVESDRFSEALSFVAFHPFKNAEEALANMMGISTGEATPTLTTFLETNLPSGGGLLSADEEGRKKGKKTKKDVLSAEKAASGRKVSSLGVADPLLAKSLAAASNKFSVHFNSSLVDVFRACRSHIEKVVKISDTMKLPVFQVGLGHSYSRKKIQFDPNRQDKSIMQSIALIDSLDKNINRFALRLREWYSWHFPELGKILSDHLQFCAAVSVIGDRSTATPLPTASLLEVLYSQDLVDQIEEASKHSFGQEITPQDFLNIRSFAEQVVRLYRQREHLISFLSSKLETVSPNLQALLGDVLAARLISHAGSLVSLAKYPSSTIQILGAEKALFRALKSKGNTPKYGLLFQSTFIGQAKKGEKGRISRYLANKCSLAARIDSFRGEGIDGTFGGKMKEQIVNRLGGGGGGSVKRRRNIDVMREAIREDEARVSKLKQGNELLDGIESTELKKKKKKQNEKEETKKKKKVVVEDEGEDSKKEKKSSKSEDSAEVSGKKRKLVDIEGSSSKAVESTTLASPQSNASELASIPKKKKKKQQEV